MGTLHIMFFLLQIAVEGNIASGKSTLLRMFAKQYSAKASNLMHILQLY